jgi:hypothetical protein
MRFEITDYNECDTLLKEEYRQEWKEIEDTILKMPIFLKASDQKGKLGVPIFDPVGTNDYLKGELVDKSWSPNSPIPVEYKFLGLDIDFEKRGIILEAQFSNYPFLLNNILRSELFFRAKLVFSQHPSFCLMIVTKAGGFPASNSTLYYEQAKSQLNSLCAHKIFSIPVRLIGLFPDIGNENEVVWTKYENSRYSRTVEKREAKKFKVSGEKRFRFEEGI